MDESIKRKHDALVDAQRTAWDSLMRRTGTEWKVCMALWTAMTAFSALLIRAGPYDDPSVGGLLPWTVGAAVLILAAHLVFVLGVARGNDIDHRKLQTYEDAMRGITGIAWSADLEARINDAKKHRMPLGRWAQVFQMLVTLTLALAACGVVWWLGTGGQPGGHSIPSSTTPWATVVMAIATVVMAMATVVYALFTSRLAEKTAAMCAATEESAAAAKESGAAAQASAAATKESAAATRDSATASQVIASATQASVDEMRRQFGEENRAALQVSVYGAEPTEHEDGRLSLVFAVTNTGRGAAVLPVVRPDWVEWGSGEVGYMWGAPPMFPHEGAFPYGRIRGSALLPGETRYFTLQVPPEGGTFAVVWSDNVYSKYSVWSWRLHSTTTHHVWCTELLMHDEGGPDKLVAISNPWEVGYFGQTETAPDS